MAYIPIRYETSHELKSKVREEEGWFKKRSILMLGALPVHCRSYGRKGLKRDK